MDESCITSRLSLCGTRMDDINTEVINDIKFTIYMYVCLATKAYKKCMLTIENETWRALN